MIQLRRRRRRNRDGKDMQVRTIKRWKYTDRHLNMETRVIKVSEGLGGGGIRRAKN